MTAAHRRQFIKTKLPGTPIRATTKGELLRILRKNKQLSQTDLADLMGLYQGNICQMEYGERAIGNKMARKFAKVLGVPYKIFLD